jgi:ketosteroid isomerase-like protein
MPANAEVVDRFIAAFEAGDVDAALECMDPDVELLPIRAQLDGSSYRGHDGYRRLLDDFAADWDDLRLVRERTQEEGDRVLTTGRLTATGKTSGVALDVPLALLYELRDGKVVRFQSFTDPEEALRITGLGG